MRSIPYLSVIVVFAIFIGIHAAYAGDGPTIEPGTRKFLDALAVADGPPIYTLSPAAARAVLDKTQATSADKMPADEEDRTMTLGPKNTLRLHIVRPQGHTEQLPVIMYFHGGGWILGDKETHDRLVRELANGAHAVVVFVDYDRSPEAQYPVAIEQAYYATRYVAAHGDEFNADGTRLAIAGDSAGGNMVAAVSMIARERGGPSILFQAMFYPVTDAGMNTESYSKFANGPWLTKKAMEWFWNAYEPDVSKRKDPKISPLQASLDQLKGLPPALIITDENDVLRDEGEAYGAKLAQAGVPVTQVRYLGTIHDFMMLNGLAETRPARAAIAQASAILGKALNK